MAIPSGWFYWAILSAVVAAMTAIFAKIGVHGVDSDLATLIRTVIWAHPGSTATSADPKLTS